MELRKVFIARDNRTNFHSLFEVIPQGYDESRRGVLDPETMNRLVQWKSLNELVEVLGETGPMVALDLYKESTRRISIDDAVAIAESQGTGEASQGYGKVDEAFLYM